MTDNLRRRRLRPLMSGVVLRSQTDARLAALAAGGSQQAFSTIYERYRRELVTHAGRIVRPDRADDVVQHTMLAAWTAVLAGTEITDLRGWLHRVVHNAALDTVRRRGYDDGEIPDAWVAPAGTDELAEGRMQAATALAAIAELPESQRRALMLTALEGQSGHDAALEMGISDGAMHQLVYRARTAVRAAVTAITPLPLISWLGAAAAAPTTSASIGLGAAGGSAIVAKIAAVVAVSAVTLGATHALQDNDHRRHAVHIPRARAVLTASQRAGQAARLVASPARASVSAAPSGRAPAAPASLARAHQRGQSGSSGRGSQRNAQSGTGQSGNVQAGGRQAGRSGGAQSGGAQSGGAQSGGAHSGGVQRSGSGGSQSGGGGQSASSIRQSTGTIGQSTGSNGRSTSATGTIGQSTTGSGQPTGGQSGNGNN
ncbi:MAG: RNA polymerase sigma factor [Solirubrobacteraceae bacterium]